jgi:hypothetical protein
MAIAGYLLELSKNDDGSEDWKRPGQPDHLNSSGTEHAFRLITYRSKTPSQHVFDAFLTYLKRRAPVAQR